MTRQDILNQAARELRDTSPNFITDVLNPAFDFVLADLAAAEAIGAQRSSNLFDVRENQRDYETREICGLTPHYPNRVLSLTVYAWGITDGQIPRAKNWDEFERARLSNTEAKRGRWQLWRVHPNNRILQVDPPADAASDGLPCEVVFERPPHLIALDQDIVDIELEDIETLVAGLRAKCAIFSEDTAGQMPDYAAVYQAGKSRMWGRRWNNRPGRIKPHPF